MVESLKVRRDDQRLSLTTRLEHGCYQSIDVSRLRFDHKDDTVMTKVCVGAYPTALNQWYCPSSL